MEHIIVAIAALLAGVGTGLVGLSAATVMVPLLVVLCPTFGGEHGAYMATAIALASDILGSAVTTFVYAKNKHVDLKHGWILLACIVGMCAVGSIAAFFTHQQVLGGFSLFLCVAIGIRFLVKPDAKEQSEIAAQPKLNLKQIVVSLFFGLTIGFGTGFFGSGGGMMMLIVFTAFLGYDRKSAVGTSTFIMTFTALIASTSHILLHPALVLEEWDLLLLSVVVATIASLVSARFANRVKGKVVGLITGVILLILGLVLVLLNYIDFIPAVYLTEVLHVFGIWIAMIIAAAIILIVLRFTVKIADYIFRKLLHLIAIASIIPLVLLTEIWFVSVICIAIFLVLIVVALKCVEDCAFYDNLFVQKRKHEIIKSFLGLFIMMAIILTLCWGMFGKPYLAVAAIMAWGPGDGMAAIIGIRFGKHKFSGRLIEGAKSIEGCVAMAVTSFVSTFLVIFLMGGISWFIALPYALLVAVVSAFTELYTLGGWDTVTVPSAALVALLPLAFLF